MDIKSFLTEEEVGVVEGMIGVAEKVTSGEIKICIVQSADRQQGETSQLRVERRAIKEFTELNLDDTIEHTGIILLISINDRRVAVYGGKAINDKCDQSTWDTVVAQVIDGIKKGQHAEGLCLAIALMGNILSEHFPPSAENPDEISNEIIFKI